MSGYSRPSGSGTRFAARMRYEVPMTSLTPRARRLGSGFARTRWHLACHCCDVHESLARVAMRSSWLVRGICRARHGHVLPSTNLLERTPRCAVPGASRPAVFPTS